MNYKDFVKQEFQKNKNSGLTAPELMKKIGIAWQEHKAQQGVEKPSKTKAPKTPKTKAPKTPKRDKIPVKGAGMGVKSSVPLSSMRSVSISRPEPTFLVTNGAIHGSGFWSDLSDGFKSVISTVAPILPMLL